MENFGNKLKELRLRTGESQKDLAKTLNVSFQSISKWEQGMHYPDVFMVKQIADHYKVSIDYLFDQSEMNKKKETFILDTTINEDQAIVTWTDYEYQGTIAPKAYLDSTRHRAGNGLLKTHPGPKGYLIIAVDENNKICFMAEHRNNKWPICGPQGHFYSDVNGYGSKNPCLIIEDTFEPWTYQNTNTGHEKDFEFVIPKKGFLINIPYESKIAKDVIIFMVPKTLGKQLAKFFPCDRKGRDLFGAAILLNGELNDVDVYLKGNQLIFEKEVEVVPSSEKEYYAYEELKNIVEDLESEVEALKDRIDELEGQICDLESQIDDLEEQVEDLEEQVEDL